jgi:hypothetical protein
VLCLVLSSAKGELRCCCRWRSKRRRDCKAKKGSERDLIRRELSLEFCFSPTKSRKIDGSIHQNVYQKAAQGCVYLITGGFYESSIPKIEVTAKESSNYR